MNQRTTKTGKHSAKTTGFLVFFCDFQVPRLERLQLRWLENRPNLKMYFLLKNVDIPASYVSETQRVIYKYYLQLNVRGSSSLGSMASMFLLSQKFGAVGGGKKHL